MRADVILSLGQAGFRGPCYTACPVLEAMAWSPQSLGALPVSSSAPLSCFPLKIRPTPLGAVLAGGVHWWLSLISWRPDGANPHFNIESYPLGGPSATLANRDLEIKNF